MWRWYNDGRAAYIPPSPPGTLKPATPLAFKNPVTAYAHIEPPKQHQPEPGLDAELQPKADLGEDTYRGTGRLDGRKAIVTGADSGIGAATAIAFAREGADVVLSYLPEEFDHTLKTNVYAMF